MDMMVKIRTGSQQVQLNLPSIDNTIDSAQSVKFLILTSHCWEWPHTWPVVSGNSVPTSLEIQYQPAWCSILINSGLGMPQVKFLTLLLVKFRAVAQVTSCQLAFLVNPVISNPASSVTQIRTSIYPARNLMHDSA
jgi:hypothetical protein